MNKCINREEFYALTNSISNGEDLSMTLMVPRKFKFQATKSNGKDGKCFNCMNTGQLFEVEYDDNNAYLKEIETGFKALVTDVDGYKSLTYIDPLIMSEFGANTVDESQKKSGLLHALSQTAGNVVNNITNDSRVKQLGNKIIGSTVKAAETALFLSRGNQLDCVNKGVIDGLQ